MKKWTYICPGCSAAVAITKTQSHLLVCPTPSNNIDQVKRFAGSVCACKGCGRLISNRSVDEHQHNCKQSSVSQSERLTGQNRNISEPYGSVIKRAREARVDVLSTPLRVASRQLVSPEILLPVQPEVTVHKICRKCNQTIGPHSMRFHFVNRCTKSVSGDISPGSSYQAQAEENVNGWWHGGE